MTLHMDVEERKCECGRPAVSINRCDLGEVSCCDERPCQQRSSRTITDGARKNPARLKVFDDIRGHIDAALGQNPPTDRVLAVAFALLDSAAPLIVALMGVDISDENAPSKAAVDRWVFGSIDRLGVMLTPFASPPDPKH